MSITALHSLPRASLRSVLKERALWLLIALWIVYCYRPLFGGDTFFFRDITYFFFPQETLFSELLKSGEFPVWDAYHHGGHPYIADVNNSPLYPTNLLFVLFPAVKAFTLFLVFHYILSSISAYLFGRALGLQKIASFVVGLVYGFCGYTISLNDHPTRLAAVALLPLIFLCWHLFLQEQGHRKKWFLLTTIFGVLQVIAGAPEVNILMMLSLLGWTFAYPCPSLPFFRRFAAWVLLGVFILGLASFQTFPVLVAVEQSSRGEGLDYRIFTQWSFHPVRLLEMLFPAFRGFVDRLPYNIYFWGGDLGDRGYPYIPNVYFGWVTMTLAGLGLVLKSQLGLPMRIRRFLGAWFVLLLVFALGRFLPFFHILYHYVPVISWFRYPIKFLLTGAFPIALLAGCGAEILFGKYSVPASRSIINCLWGIAVFLIAGTLVFSLSKGFAVQLQHVLFHHPGSEISFLGMIRSLVQASTIWLLFTLLVMFRRRTKKTWYYWALAGILAVDLLSAGKRIAPLAPQAFFTAEPALAKLVRSEIDDGKLFRTADPLPTMFHFPVDERFPVPPDHVMWFYRWQLETLRQYLAANYKIPVVFHSDYNKMEQRQLVRLTEAVESLSWTRKLPLLAAGGVTLILSAENLSVPGIERVAEIPNWSDLPLYLYRHTRAAPRVGFVNQWKMTDSDEEVLALMLQPGYDPRQHVVLQRPQPESFFERFSVLETSERELFIPNSCDEKLKWHVTPTGQTSSSASYSVSTNCDGYLVFSELFYPGWTVTVSGERQPILRANVAFSAIALEAGEHEIRRFYRPKGLLPGISISLLFCGVLALIILRGKKMWSFISNE